MRNEATISDAGTSTSHRRPQARIIDNRPGEPGPDGPDPTAPEDLTGPVAAHYKKLGGKNWGWPLHGP